LIILSLKNKMEEEIWRDVVGYEGYYKISNRGNVESVCRSVAGKHNGISVARGGLLKNQTLPNKYLYVMFSKLGTTKNGLIHRLVAESFIPNPENKPCVNHINGIKSDNRVSNLEWCTYKENTNHAVLNGLLKSPSKDKFGYDSMSGKEVFQYDLDKNFINKFGSAAEAARMTGVLHRRICHNAHGDQKTAGGFIWRYEQI
jgi:hypothetical protein